MKIDRKLVREVFDGYVSKYDLGDIKIRLKVEHTYKVAEICEKIAKSLDMTEYDVDMAWLLGMLHDIGRFEQLRRYHTFIDSLSVNHASLSGDILFKDRMIDEFLANARSEGDCLSSSAGRPFNDSSCLSDDKSLSSSEYRFAAGGFSSEMRLIERAIRLHNVFRLPDGLTERERTFSDLLRDADKVDILRVNCTVPVEEIYDKPPEVFLLDPISDEVYEDAMRCENVDRSHSKTTADSLVTKISFVFGLVYAESFREVRRQGYLDEMLDFKSENPETLKRLSDIKSRVLAFMDEKL